MTNRKRRRQTRTRRTTGYPPELHNASVQLHRARRARHKARRARRLDPLVRLVAQFLGEASEAYDRAIAKYLEGVAAFHAPVAVIPTRRSRVPSCDTCWQADSMTPHHDPSPACESGGRDHCACDTCY